MKYLTQNPNNSSDLPSKPQPEPQQPQSQLKSHDLSQRQLSNAINTISKIHKISKGHITKMKQKYKELNGLFCVMSQFFINKKKKTSDEKKNQKLKRIQLRHKAQMHKMREFHHNKYGLPQQMDENQNESSSQRAIQPVIQLNEQQKILQQNSVPTKNSTCYICSKIYIQIDDVYHQHCPACASLGKEKRFQTANLANMTAFVTGARIKIGFEIVLKLLRDGATVYATTRFVKDALIRYQKQTDYESFKQRLFLIQCDLLSSSQVNSLIKYIKEKVNHLDILIHNAAQTIARPPQFYSFQLQNQNKQLTYSHPQQIKYVESTSYPSLEMYKSNAILCQQNNSSICLKKTDQFGQPLDLRPINSWKQKIQDVSLIDCLSSQVINSTMPFYITGQLRCIMGGDKPSWIVNVSSMQGVFYRKNKTCFHPHTNMAKASLNMMTRTCGGQMSKKNIFMTSVDTGWVTNQNPYEYSINMSKKHDFLPPLDCIEGAMRVLDPIYQGVNKQKYLYGVFLKNYQQYNW